MQKYKKYVRNHQIQKYKNTINTQNTNNTQLHKIKYTN